MSAGADSGLNNNGIAQVQPRVLAMHVIHEVDGALKAHCSTEIDTSSIHLDAGHGKSARNVG